MSLLDRVRAAVAAAFESSQPGAGQALAEVTWVVERPKRPEHGDLATNLALAVNKKIGKPPRAIAEGVVRALAESAVVASAEVAGPGFINLRLTPREFHTELAAIVAAGPAWGRSAAGTGQRINLEFVSANPTGPVTIASGRNAVLGDALARLLEATGHRVTREYYINDRGNQVQVFAESVRAAAGLAPLPEEGYRGAYVAELAEWLRTVDPAVLEGDLATLGRVCVTWMLRGIPGSRTLPGIRPSLADLGVYFDVWFSEDSLYRWDAVPIVMRQLEQAGRLLHKDGAVFFQAPEGALDDKERVVRKSDGAWSYFASDLAYFADKMSRGFDRFINVLGADHHGYIARIRNGLSALGIAPERFDALLYQLVFLTKGGEVVKMGKRAGNIITIDELMDEIDDAAGRKGAGADAIRFFFLSRGANSNVEFDIELAKKKSLDNPVFYVQYGYARLCSIQRRAAEAGFDPRAPLRAVDWSKLVHPDELGIAHRLSEFPEVVAAAAQLEPHRMVFYVQDLARDFQSYFTRLKGEDDPILPPASVRATPAWRDRWDTGKTQARLAWIEAIRLTYAQALALLGVSAPERMDKPADATEAAADD